MTDKNPVGQCTYTCSGRGAYNKVTIPLTLNDGVDPQITAYNHMVGMFGESAMFHGITPPSIDITQTTVG